MDRLWYSFPLHVCARRSAGELLHLCTLKCLHSLFLSTFFFFLTLLLSIGKSPSKHLAEDGKQCEYFKEKSEVVR